MLIAGRYRGSRFSSRLGDSCDQCRLHRVCFCRDWVPLHGRRAQARSSRRLGSRLRLDGGLGRRRPVVLLRRVLVRLEGIADVQLLPRHGYLVGLVRPEAVGLLPQHFLGGLVGPLRLPGLGSVEPSPHPAVSDALGSRGGAGEVDGDVALHDLPGLDLAAVPVVEDVGGAVVEPVVRHVGRVDPFAALGEGVVEGQRVEPPHGDGDPVVPAAGGGLDQGRVVVLEEELECALVSESVLRLPLRLVDRVGEHGRDERDGPGVDAQGEGPRVQAVPVGGDEEMHAVEVAPRLGRRKDFEGGVGVQYEGVGVEPAKRCTFNWSATGAGG